MGEIQPFPSQQSNTGKILDFSFENTLDRLGWANCVLYQSQEELVSVLDTTFTIRKVSKAIENIFGPDVAGRKCYNVYHGRTTPCDECPTQKLMTTGELVCSFEHTSNGRTFYIQAFPLSDNQGKVVAVVEHAVDITGKKNAERELAETSAFWKTVYNSVTEAISIINVSDFSIVEVNLAFLEKYGLTREQIIGKTCFAITHHEEAPCAGPDHSCPLMTSVATGNYSVFEHIHYDKDGKPLTFEVSAVPVRNEAGQIIRVVHVTRDVTERKQAERQLIDSELRYRTLFNQAGDSIFLLQPAKDTMPIIVDVNDAALSLHGFTRSEMIGKPVSFLDVNYTDAAGEERRKTREANVRNRFEVVHRKKNGGTVSLSVDSTSLRVGDRTLILATLHDITDSKRLEEERLRSAKLESLGILAGGIAHDFNNVLAGILANIQLANLYIARKADHNAAEILGEAELATLRARDLTQQLLTFSKGGAPIKKTVNLGELVKSSANFILSGSKARATFDIQSGLLAVNADEGQIAQVINNIVVNAEQAMPVGGTIDISVTNLKEAEKKSLGFNGDKYVKISVTDHGTGIPESLHEKLFDPYFTTKQKGSGLGLATAYSIIKNHDGLLKFESEIGKGTTFFIYLPAMKTKVKVQPKQSNLCLTAPPKKQCRVLVADDEKGLRDALKRALGAAGFNVVAVENGEQAVARYREGLNDGKPFKAVILDLTMPGGMGGKETMKELTKLDPKVKAIVSSGYANDPVMSEHRKYGFAAVVTKPYGIQEMCKKLTEVIRQTPTSM